MLKPQFTPDENRNARQRLKIVSYVYHHFCSHKKGVSVALGAIPEMLSGKHQQIGEEVASRQLNEPIVTRLRYHWRDMLHWERTGSHLLNLCDRRECPRAYPWG